MKTEQYILRWYTAEGMQMKPQMKTIVCAVEDAVLLAKKHSKKVNSLVEIYKSIGMVDYSK